MIGVHQPKSSCFGVEPTKYVPTPNMTSNPFTKALVLEGMLGAKSYTVFHLNFEKRLAGVNREAEEFFGVDAGNSLFAIDLTSPLGTKNGVTDVF